MIICEEWNKGKRKIAIRRFRFSWDCGLWGDYFYKYHKLWASSAGAESAKAIPIKKKRQNRKHWLEIIKYKHTNVTYQLWAYYLLLTKYQIMHNKNISTNIKKYDNNSRRKKKLFPLPVI